MILRKHQLDFSQTIDGIIAGSGIRKIVVNATPGSGKSLLPVIAGRLITAGLADRIAWVCPRSSLQDQGERAFLDPRFRELLRHNLTIRSSCNDENPSRGTNGWVGTIQALGMDKNQTALRDFRRHRYILVSDEGHHSRDDGDWTKSIAPLYDEAAYVVIMSGTMGRADKEKIAFIPYVETAPGEFRPYFAGAKDTAYIEYSRTDALNDKSIIPLEFILHDGLAKWGKGGREWESKISTSVSGSANDALFTALHTGYARELLNTALDHWTRYRAGHPSSRLLVVAANIAVTKEYTDYLKGKGMKANIATSDDDKGAAKAIKEFKAGRIDALISCQVCYEGLDVPAISHVACLTRIRSEFWITQMCGRAVRIDPQAGPYETQKGYIFAPADRMFTELARKIEADQCQAVAKAKAEKEKREEFTLDGGSARPGITPLSSKMLGHKPTQQVYGFADHGEQRTQREIENELREEINKHVRAFCRTYCCKPAHLNHELKKRMGKSREEMTVAELERLKIYVKGQYELPVNKI